jgi:hypothetical protein
MEIKIVAVGPSSIDYVTYIMGVTPTDLYVRFSPLKKSTTVDDFNPNDFSLSDTIDLDINSLGPTEAFNKTKNKSVDIYIHEVNINTMDEVRKKYPHDFPLQ